MTGCHNQSMGTGTGTGLAFPVYIPDPSLIQLPFRRDSFPPSLFTPADVARHDHIRPRREMLDLNRHLAAARALHEKEALAGMIDATDRQIDRLVYGLTEEEILIPGWKC